MSASEQVTADMPKRRADLWYALEVLLSESDREIRIERMVKLFCEYVRDDDFVNLAERLLEKR